METTLVINPGGTSRKYALYSNDHPVLEVIFEDTKSGFEMCSQSFGGQQVRQSVTEEEFNNSSDTVADIVDKFIFKEAVTPLQFVVLRVVAPGSFFQHHAHIDDVYIEKLKEKEVSAPLHVPVLLKEIKSARKYYRQLPLIAASDSAFHKDMPGRAREYSINVDDSYTHDIHRFGYHGLSVSSVVRKIHPVIGMDPERMIVCHIGSGVSVSAVKNGKSVDTTMGYSPSSGLPMGSRAGDIEGTALLELMRAKHWKPRDVELYLNTQGGLLALSGEADIRKLLDRRSKNDKVAVMALEKFVYEIQKAIASQIVALGGLDVLVFTATASVRSPELRSLIIDGLGHLGITIGEDRNNVLLGKDGVLSTRNSPVKAVVMRTDEMGEMALVPTLLAVSNEIN